VHGAFQSLECSVTANIESVDRTADNLRGVGPTHLIPVQQSKDFGVSLGELSKRGRDVNDVFQREIIG
jgi:hypothetical protein